MFNSQTSSKWFGLPVMFYATLHHYHNKTLISAIDLQIRDFKSNICGIRSRLTDNRVTL
jgi:hypothetical protein